MPDLSKWKYCPACGAEVTPAQRHGVPSISCTACGFRHFDNPVAVVAALVETDDGVILVRAKNWPPKAFGLVSGFIEPGEAPEAAAIREVREELGLDAAIDHLIGVFPFEAMNQVLVAYHLTASGIARPNEEIEEVKIIGRDRLKGWEFGTGLAVSAWLRSHGASREERFPINALLEQLGRRWALRILWELSRRGPLSFNALRQACDDLSPDTLSTRLKDLRESGLLEQAGEPGSQVWRLTAKATAMKSPLLSLASQAATSPCA